jgi:type IV secretory pathway VirB4 component
MFVIWVSTLVYITMGDNLFTVYQKYLAKAKKYSAKFLPSVILDKERSAKIPSARMRGKNKRPNPTSLSSIFF